MTKHQREQYEIRYKIEKYTCYLTKLQATQQAHRISNTKTNRKIFGKYYIDHHFNLVPARNTSNDHWNIGNKLGTAQKLIDLIKILGDKMLTVREINDYLGIY